VLTLEQELMHMNGQGEQVARLRPVPGSQVSSLELRGQELAPSDAAQELLASHPVDNLHGVAVDKGHPGLVGDKNVLVIEVADDDFGLVGGANCERQVGGCTYDVTPVEATEPVLAP
jgi:hypothetical protein